MMPTLVAIDRRARRIPFGGEELRGLRVGKDPRVAGDAVEDRVEVEIENLGIHGGTTERGVKLEDGLDQPTDDPRLEVEGAPSDPPRAIRADQPPKTLRRVAAELDRMRIIAGPDSAHARSLNHLHSRGLDGAQERVVEVGTIVDPLRSGLAHVHGPDRAAELEPAGLPAAGRPPDEIVQELGAALRQPAAAELGAREVRPIDERDVRGSNALADEIEREGAPRGTRADDSDRGGLHARGVSQAGGGGNRRREHGRPSAPGRGRSRSRRGGECASEGAGSRAVRRTEGKIAARSS